MPESKDNTFKSVVNLVMYKYPKKYPWKHTVAKAMGISPQDLSRYYNGVYDPPHEKAMRMYKKVGATVKIIVE